MCHELRILLTVVARIVSIGGERSGKIFAFNGNVVSYSANLHRTTTNERPNWLQNENRLEKWVRFHIKTHLCQVVCDSLAPVSRFFQVRLVASERTVRVELLRVVQDSASEPR